jgi:preprotein translocase subunit YajC
MQSDLRVGDEVMLTSGIIGVLRSLDGETVQLQVSEGVTVRVVRAAVGKVTTPVARDDDTDLTADPAVDPEEK